MTDQVPADPKPQAARPHVPGYGIPETEAGMLPWTHVIDRMEAARNYWIGTASIGGVPHAVPTWGVWMEGSLYFGGGPTRWARNLAENPRACVHLESGDNVVIVEGMVGRVEDRGDPVVRRVEEAYEAKYNFRHPPPFWVLRPRVAFAWSEFPKNATRWRFD